MFVSNQEPSTYIGHQVQHPIKDFNGQCAVGAQYVCGTVLKNGVTRDAPSTNKPEGGGPWRRGPSLKDGYQPAKGTMIAWGWDKDGNYPSAPTGNHTALYEGPGKQKGDFTVISQNSRTIDVNKPSPFSRDLENVDRNDWYVVVADSRYDKRPTQSKLVQMPDDPAYPNLDIPYSSATKAPTDSARKGESKGLFKRIKEWFTRKKKE
jgi:hypothetical protein